MSEKSKLKNVILICGDPLFYPEKLIKIKKYFFPNIKQIPPNLWKEIDIPSFKKKSSSEEKWLNLVDSEITCSSWIDDNKKFILLKEIIDSPAFLEFLFNAFKNIPHSNYFVICDKNNVLNNGKACFGKLRWIDFKQFCSQNATISNAGIPMSEFSISEKTKYIVEEFKKQDKKITQENANLLLEIVGDNRLALNSEINKISISVDGNDIKQEDVVDLTFPMSKDYPVWSFYTALNTGSYSKIMNAAENLMSNGFNYDGIIILCLKQIRWHVIYSHLLFKYDSLNKINNFSVNKFIKKDIFKQKLLDPRILNAVSTDNEIDFKNDNLPSNYNNKDILNFINNILPKSIVSENSNKKEMVLNKNIERYVGAFDGLYELRTGSTDSKDAIFASAIRKISIIR
jgi:hypothetical protein